MGGNHLLRYLGNYR